MFNFFFESTTAKHLNAILTKLAVRGYGKYLRNFIMIYIEVVDSQVITVMFIKKTSYIVIKTYPRSI
jgi:hypothetical protein